MKPGSEVVIAACLFAAALTPGTDATPLGPPPQLDGVFTLGVVRRDGIIIPFATYDGKRWRTDWPPPRERVEVPISLRNVPSRWWGPMAPVDSWYVWVRDGPSRTVRVRQPDWFEAQCLKQIGLRTDYRSDNPPPGPDAQPYPKDGLAISSPREILRIEILPPGDPPPQVVDQFNIEERVAVLNDQARAAIAQEPWSGPRSLTRQKREAVRLKTEAIYAVSASSARVYFFEVSRQYAGEVVTSTKPECASVSYGSGWFANETDGLRRLAFRVAIAPCDRYGLLYMLPLGAMRVSNRLFWIAQLSGWDYEEYDIMEIKEKEVDQVLQVVGGRCS